MTDETTLNQRRVIAGLGNPGREYARTRHNVGFQIVDRLAEKYGLSFSKMMNRGMVALGEIEGQKVVLVKPQTFMNDSGACVGPILKFYKTDPSGLLVIYDDLDLPAGQLRLRKFGGTGGHNGMRSVQQHVGTQNFPRLRVGIGRPPGRMDPMDYVLQAFSSAELDAMAEVYDCAVDGIAHWLKDDIERVMNVVNLGEDGRRARPERAEGTTDDKGKSTEPRAQNPERRAQSPEEK
jgi:peptidyl-tRNA hydrolase, PTH1 family